MASSNHANKVPSYDVTRIGKEFLHRTCEKFGQLNQMMMYQPISNTFTRLLYSLQAYEFHPIKLIFNFVLVLIT